MVRLHCLGIPTHFINFFHPFLEKHLILQVGPAVEFLIHSYPKYVTVESLPLPSIDQRVSNPVLWSFRVILGKVKVDRFPGNFVCIFKKGLSNSRYGKRRVRSQSDLVIEIKNMWFLSWKISEEWTWLKCDRWQGLLSCLHVWITSPNITYFSKQLQSNLFILQYNVKSNDVIIQNCLFFYWKCNIEAFP